MDVSGINMPLIQKLNIKEQEIDFNFLLPLFEELGNNTLSYFCSMWNNDSVA